MFLLLLCLVSAVYPNPCEHYEWYDYDTSHKGYDDNIGWDYENEVECNGLDKNSSEPLNYTCGECDFGRIKGATWLRFRSPLTQMYEVPGNFCKDFDPEVELDGHCNGKAQALLKPLDNGNFTIVWTHTIVGSSPNFCWSLEFLNIEIKKEDCETFYIYFFPQSFDDESVSKSFCTPTVAGKVKSYKTSFCMVDEVDIVSLKSDQQFYLQDSTATIEAEREPTPLTSVTCVDGEGAPVELEPDSANDHYSHTYTLSMPKSTVSCTLEGPNSTSIKLEPVTFAVQDHISDASKPKTIFCRVILGQFANDLNLLYIADQSGVEHTLPEIGVFPEGSSTHRLELLLPAADTKVPDNRRTLEKTFTCGFIDPLSKVRLASPPFTLTLNKTCPGDKGFTSTTATQCGPCPANFYATDSRCVPCAPDTESVAGSITCTNVPPPNTLAIIIGVVAGTLLIVIGIGVFVAIKVKQSGDRKRNYQDPVTYRNTMASNHYSTT